VPSTDEPLLLHRDSSLAAASWRGLFLEVWTARGSTRHFRLVHECHVKCIRANAGRKIAHLTVIHDFTIAALDVEARQVLADRNASAYPHTSRSALVMPATGFSASIVRSVITGLMLLARPPYAHVVTSSLDQATRWLAEPPDAAKPQPYTAAELRSAYEWLLARDGLRAAAGA